MKEAVFFENVLIKFLFTIENVRDKVMPFLVPELFEDHKNVQLIKSVIKMYEKFERFPTVPEMRLELDNESVYKRLLEIMETDVSEYQSDFLLEEIEEFMREKLIHNINVDIAVNLSNKKIDDIKKTPDQLREAIAFSFDSKVGLDFMEEEERLYKFLHDVDRVIPTSIGILNRIIEGGFHEKSLTLFMAETNMGKSLIMTSLAVDCVLRNKNVLYVSCEMSENKISERIMSNMFDVNTEDLKLLTKDKFHSKFEKVKKQVSKKIIVKEYPPTSINANHIRNLLKELKVRKKFTPDIIFIDYLGIMNPIHKNKGDNTYLEVKRISEEVRAVAVEMSLPIVSAVQTNRKGFGGAEIDLTDISDSIGTAATADVIIGVTQSNDLRKVGKYYWMVLKNRYGLNKKGMNVCVDYYKMRVFEDEETEVGDTTGSISRDPPSDKDKKKKVSSAIKDAKGVLSKDTNDKFKKMIDFE